MTVIRHPDEPPRILALDWMPFSEAAICLEGTCEALYRLSLPTCPKCGGSARMPIERWLQSAKGDRIL